MGSRQFMTGDAEIRTNVYLMCDLYYMLECVCVGISPDTDK